MKIFISWSGSISKKLAEAFRQWIPGVIQAARPYYSPDDISKGSRWSTEIAKELDNARIGIICLTKDNLQAPWIMFEAGALSKNLEISKVCPILFGIEPSDIEGPLVQFQAAKFSKEEMKKVIRMVNLELGENALSPDVLNNVFEMWWPKLKDSVDAIMKESVSTGSNNIRSERDILEEILLLTRAANMTNERGSFREKISPTAVYELCNEFLKIAMEIQKFVDSPPLFSLIEHLNNLRKALRHTISRLNITAEHQNKFSAIFMEASGLIIYAYELAHRNHQKSIENDFSKEEISK